MQEQSEMRYLYRALRKIEIESGYILIPKDSNPFFSDPMFGVDMTFPIPFGSSINTVRQHQWQQNGFPTRGISTTPLFERAKFYAQRNRVIVKIDISKLESFGITTYRVNEVLKDYPADIAVPEDDEVIIVFEQDGAFPKEVIEEIIHL